MTLTGRSDSVQHLVFLFLNGVHGVWNDLKSLHISAFDFSLLATTFIISTLVSILMHFLLLVVFVDMVAMANENESKNLDLDLCSIHHNDRDKKSDTVKREEDRLALKS